MADHDQRSGLLICPNGYMVLTSKPGFIDKRMTESARSMAKNEVEVELSDEEVIDILRDRHMEMDEDNGNETIETPTETDINQNTMDPCACATTSSTCYDCGRPTCDLCSPNGEENSRRKCKLLDHRLKSHSWMGNFQHQIQTHQWMSRTLLLRKEAMKLLTAQMMK